MSVRNRLLVLALGLACAATSHAGNAPTAATGATPPAVVVEARAMLERLVATRTTPGQGAVLPMAQYLSDRFVEAGFSASDIEQVRKDDDGALIVHYRPAPASTKAPVVFLAHMDVVDARRED